MGALGVLRMTLSDCNIDRREVRNFDLALFQTVCFSPVRAFLRMLEPTVPVFHAPGPQLRLGHRGIKQVYTEWESHPSVLRVSKAVFFNSEYKRFSSCTYLYYQDAIDKGRVLFGYGIILFTRSFDAHKCSSNSDRIRALGPGNRSIIQSVPLPRRRTWQLRRWLQCTIFRG